MTDAETKQEPDIAARTDADPFASAWVRYLAPILMTAVAAIIAIAVDSKVSIPNLSLVFVIPVVIAGVAFGLGPSLWSAVLGALAFNFFLTEPRYSLAIDDVSNIWAMALLFVVGLIVSGVAFTSHRRAAEAAFLKRQAIVLQDYSQQVQVPRNRDAIARTTSRALAALFGTSAVVMLIEDGQLVSIKATGDVEPAEAELEAARSASAAGTVARSGIYPYDASRFDFWPVQTPDGQSAVIGLAFDPDERPSAPDLPVKVVACMFALMLDRQRGRSAAD